MDDTYQPISTGQIPQIPAEPAPEMPPVAPVTPIPPVVEAKKEHNLKPVILAILAAVLLLGGGAGIYFGLNPATPKPTPTPVPVQARPEPEPELTLSLTSPTIDTIAENKMLKVSGTTLPNIPVVIMTEDFDSSVVSDDTGNFETEVELTGGVNTLVVTAMAENGEEKSETQEVVFDDELVLGVNTTKSSTPGGQMKTLVKNDVESITKQYKVDKNTKYADEKNKPLKLNTVKPKEKAVAVIGEDGATPAGQLKKAIKIFIRNATESAQIRMAKRRAVQGVVINIEGSTIYLAHQTQRERQFSVLFNDQTTVKIPGMENATTANVKVGQRIVVVGKTTDTGDLLATRIMVIPGSATGLLNKQPVTPFPTKIPTPTLISTPSATLTPTLTPTPTLILSPTQ
jgi:hypothetical protein